MVGRHSLLIFLNQVPRFLIVVDLIFFVFGGYCCEVVPSAWRRHEVNISLGHGGKRLLKFVLVVEVKNILNNKKVSPGLTFVEVDFPDYKLAGLAVREFAMSIHEVGKCISVQSFRPDLFLVLLAFGKGKLAHELEFYLVLDHLEEIFLQTKSQGVVQRKIFPLPLADQLLVRLVSLGQNQLFELIKRDVIFAVELEIGEDQFLLSSRAPQSQVSDAVDELGFGLCVRAVRRVDGENARRDEVGVGCQDLATILKFSLVGRYFVEIGCDVKGAHDGRCKIIITHFSCYIQQSLFRKQARFLGLQSTKIGQQRSYRFFSCHNQPLLACGYRRVLKNNCHRPQISMFKTAFLVNQFPLVGLYILL